MTVLQQFWNDEMTSRELPSRDVYEWCPPPETIDFGLRQLVNDLHEVVCGQQASFAMRTRCCNTDTCLSRGTHWITVVYSIECIRGHEQPWEAVRAAAATLSPRTLPRPPRPRRETIRETIPEQRQREDDVCHCPECGSTDVDFDGIDGQCYECGEYFC